MSGRLIVISNRIPRDEAPAGGLVFALHEALSEIGGIWIGSDSPGEGGEGLRKIGSGDYERYAFPLSEDEHAGYYKGYANGLLWPIFHSRRDLVSIRRGDFDAYARVNRRVAQLVAPLIEDGDTIWIHDYHFLPLAAELRAAGVKNRIGFFLHIPFPSLTDLEALPEVGRVAEWLSGYDVVGLQTQRDVAFCREFLSRSQDVEPLINGHFRRENRVFRVLAFPIGIDAEAFRALAEENERPLRIGLDKDVPLVLGVDRLDYSKGIIQRVEGFGRFLAQRDRDRHGRPTYIQIAPVSRGEVEAYRDIRAELDEVAGSINGSHADLDWTPIRYVRRNIDRDVIARLYRRADVGLVTPLADGMNLVAKEFVAAQDPADPGVLVLSKFAGAAEQLDAALLVNPYDADEIADAIRRAIEMGREERCDRQQRLEAAVFGQDIVWWRKNFLARLGDGGSVHHRFARGMIGERAGRNSRAENASG